MTKVTRKAKGIWGGLRSHLILLVLIDLFRFSISSCATVSTIFKVSNSQKLSYKNPNLGLFFGKNGSSSNMGLRSPQRGFDALPTWREHFSAHCSCHPLDPSLCCSPCPRDSLSRVNRCKCGTSSHRRGHPCDKHPGTQATSEPSWRDPGG